jgi:hypothetical protein
VKTHSKSMLEGIVQGVLCFFTYLLIPLPNSCHNPFSIAFKSLLNAFSKLLGSGKNTEVIEKGARWEILSKSMLQGTVQGYCARVQREFELPSEALSSPIRIPSRSLFNRS